MLMARELINMELERLIMTEFATMNFGGAQITNLVHAANTTTIYFQVGALKASFMLQGDNIFQVTAMTQTGEVTADPEANRQINEWAKYIYVLALPVVKKHLEQQQSQIVQLQQPAQVQHPVQMQQPIQSQDPVQMQQPMMQQPLQQVQQVAPIMTQEPVMNLVQQPDFTLQNQQIMSEIALTNLGGAQVTDINCSNEQVAVTFKLADITVDFSIRNDQMTQLSVTTSVGQVYTEGDYVNQYSQWANYVLTLVLPIIKKHYQPQPVQAQPVIQQPLQQIQPTVDPLDSLQQVQPTVDPLASLKQSPLAQTAQIPVSNDIPFSSNTDTADEEPVPPSAAKKVLSFIGNILFYVALVAVVLGVALFGLQEPGQPPRDLGGYAVMTVLTGSMHPTLPIDTLLVMGPVDTNELEVNDIITFIRPNNRVITHRIVDIRENFNSNGDRAFITKGDAVATNDPDPVMAYNVIGEIIWYNYPMGRVIVFVQEHILMIVIVGVMIVSLVFVVKKFFLVPATDDDESDDEDSSVAVPATVQGGVH